VEGRPKVVRCYAEATAIKISVLGFDEGNRGRKKQLSTCIACMFKELFLMVCSGPQNIVL
jgi:hypothetical protein